MNINKAKKEAFVIERPELQEDPVDSPFFDPELRSDRVKLTRPRKGSFQFVEEGLWSKQAETQRLRVRAYIGIRPLKLLPTTMALARSSRAACTVQVKGKSV